jgi:hypothetical protein
MFVLVIFSRTQKNLVIKHPGNSDADIELMHAAAVDHAFQGGDIAVIAASGQGQMSFIHHVCLLLSSCCNDKVEWPASRCILHLSDVIQAELVVGYAGVFSEGESNKARIFTDPHQREQVDQQGDQVAETVTRIDFAALVVVIESARICPRHPRRSRLCHRHFVLVVAVLHR